MKTIYYAPYSYHSESLKIYCNSIRKQSYLGDDILVMLTQKYMWLAENLYLSLFWGYVSMSEVSVLLERNSHNSKALKDIYKATVDWESLLLLFINRKKVCFKTLLGSIGNKLKAALKNIVLCAFAKKFQIQPSNLHFDCLNKLWKFWDLLHDRWLEAQTNLIKVCLMSL